MESEIFIYNFDFDEWPSTHINDECITRGYNHSIFEVRSNYDLVFGEDEFKPIDIDESNPNQKVDSSKIYKIKYTLNLLPRACMHVDVR